MKVPLISQERLQSFQLIKKRVGSSLFSFFSPVANNIRSACVTVFFIIYYNLLIAKQNPHLVDF